MSALAPKGTSPAFFMTETLNRPECELVYDLIKREIAILSPSDDVCDRAQVRALSKAMDKVLGRANA